MSHFERDQHGFDDAIMPNFGSKKKHTKKTKKTKDLEDKLLELNLETTTTDEEPKEARRPATTERTEAAEPDGRTEAPTKARKETIPKVTQLE